MQNISKENSRIKERILQYLDLKGVSKYRFYKDAGVTNGILSQKSGINEENLMKFLAYAKDINPYWLILGIGDPIEKEKYAILQDVNSIQLKDKDIKDNDEITQLRNNYIKNANKVIHLLEENARLKERLNKYERADN